MACSTERPLPPSPTIPNANFHSKSLLKPHSSVVSTAHKPDYSGNCLLETEHQHGGLYGMNGLTPSDWSLLTAPTGVSAYNVPFTKSKHPKIEGMKMKMQNIENKERKKKRMNDSNHFIDFNKINLGDPAKFTMESQGKSSSVNHSESVYLQNSEISGSRSSPSTSKAFSLDHNALFPVDVTNTIIHSNL